MQKVNPMRRAGFGLAKCASLLPMRNAEKEKGGTSRPFLVSVSAYLKR
jgi:hypothetical protein